MSTSTENKAEPFPVLSPIESVPTDQTQPPPRQNTGISDGAPSTSSPNSRRRTSSLLQSFMTSNPPLGMWQATGEVTSKAPSLAEIRNGSFAADGWNHEGQLEKRGANPHEIHRRRLARTSSASTRTRASDNAPTTPISPTIAERQSEDHGEVRTYFPRRMSLAQMDGPPDGIPETVPEKIPENSTATVSQPSDNDRSATESASYTGLAPAASISETPKEGRLPVVISIPSSSTSIEHPQGPDETGSYPNGYRFPAKHTWWQSTTIGMKAFGRFTLTPLGFAITIYGLNVVGWGAMIFFLLLNAAPAMCNPSCDDKATSARQIWIEIDSQVLNALFCVTGFGLIPWRFRDFYYLMKWRIYKDHSAHRRLAGYYRSWYRLPGSQNLRDGVSPPPVYSKRNPANEDSAPPYTANEIAQLEADPAIPLPVTSMPDPPLTGIRAQPSTSWSLDFLIWMYLWNTILQTFLAGFMWGYNRYTRPSWAVGLFITLGCLTGIFAGILVGIEGKKVKRAEGIPVQEFEVLESIEEYQARKKKEDHKMEKKESRHERRVVKQEKVKGHMWFTRH